MTANLNFEAESFSSFDPSSAALQELETVRDHRAGATSTVIRDHRLGALATPAHGVSRLASGMLHGGPFHGITGFANGFAGLHTPGFHRGVSPFYQGVPTRTVHGWHGSGPHFGGSRWFPQGRFFGGPGAFPFGDRNHRDSHGRWPWLSRDWRHRSRDGGVGVGYSSTDVGYAPLDTSGSGAAGSDYPAPASPPDFASSGFAPAAPAPGIKSAFSSDDPQIVGWAQACLGQIVGAWVPQDGNLDALSMRAIKIFQSRSQLPSTGTLDDNTLAALQNACHASSATQGSAQPQAVTFSDKSSLLLNALAPDSPAASSAANAGAPPPAAPQTSGPETPPPADPPMSGKKEELPYWAQEYQDHELPHARTCEPDRCTNTYLRWVQNSLNQLLGQRLAITGILDDPTIEAIKRLRSAKRLNVNESYHVGPAIESALLAAGAPPPPSVPAAKCGVSDPTKLIAILDQARGDIPLEYLLAWIDVESAWVLEPSSVTCERGYFQLYPEDSVRLGLDHDRIGTDPVYSIQSGVPFVNYARKEIEPAVKAFGVPRNGDLYWRLVKLWHWIPSAPEKILAAMSAQAKTPTDWGVVSDFVRDNADSLTRIIRRAPTNGIASVNRMFFRVDAWRRRLRR